MKAARILLASITGTAFMSLFSYFIHKKANKNYEAPAVLSALLSSTEALQKVKKKRTYQLGWLLHYIAGLSFSMLYDQVWRKTSSRPSLYNGILYGGINGIVGVLIWKAAIDKNAAPPRFEYRDYYSHLLAAHIVFGTFTAAGYMLPSLFQKKKPQVLHITDRTGSLEVLNLETGETNKGNNFHKRPQDAPAVHH